MSLASVETNDGALHMRIETQFGEQDIDPASIISFPNGLPGFDDLKEFKLFHEEDKPSVYFLQSTSDSSVQLPLVDPDMFQVNYEISLNDEELALLQLENTQDATIMVTVARHDGDIDAGIHANFMGPIILNTKARIGMQKALNQISGSVIIKAE